MSILAQPALAVLVEPVARDVVDDQEDLACCVTTHELPEELEEGGAAVYWFGVNGTAPVESYGS